MGFTFDIPAPQPFVPVFSGEATGIFGGFYDLTDGLNPERIRLVQLVRRLQEQIKLGNEDLRKDFGLSLLLLYEQAGSGTELPEVFDKETLSEAEEDEVFQLKKRGGKGRDIELLLQARRELQRAAQVDPDAHYPLARLYYDYAHIFEEYISWSGVVNHLRMALKADPGNVLAYYYLGQSIQQLVRQESDEDTLEAFAKYLEAGAPEGHEAEAQEFINSRNPYLKTQAAIERGKKRLAQGEYTDSIEAFNQAIELGDLESYYYLGQNFEALGNHARAVDAFRIAHAQVNNLPEVVPRLGRSIAALVTDVSLVQAGIDTLQQPENAFERALLQTLHDTLFQFLPHAGEILAACFSPEGRYILTGAADQTAKVWDLAQNKVIRTMKGPQGNVQAVAWSPDSRFLVLGSGTSPFPNKAARAADANEQMPVVGSETVHIREAETAALRFSLATENANLVALACSPHSLHLMTVSLDQQGDASVELWSLETGALLHRLIEDKFTVLCVAWAPTGDRVLVGGMNREQSGVARVLQADSGKEILHLPGNFPPVAAVAFSPDGKQMFTGSYGFDEKHEQNPKALLWNATTGKKQKEVTGLVSNIRSVAFSPDGKFVVMGTQPTRSNHRTRMVVWDPVSEKIVQEPDVAAAEYIHAVAVSPDSDQVLAALGDGTFKIWAARERELIFQAPARMKPTNR